MIPTVESSERGKEATTQREMAEERSGGEGEEGKSSASATNNWRKEVDVKLKRLQSLLFGADLALERGDHAAAGTLALRLIGFLDSQTRNPIDASFVSPIRAEASSKLAAASRALAVDSDRCVPLALPLLIYSGNRLLSVLFVEYLSYDLLVAV